MKYYMRNLLKLAVFDVTELSLRSAWTILSHVHCKQVAIPTSLRQTEFLHNKKVLTTGADWAARKGHLPLLQWLLVNTEEVCTTYAFDLAARHGHMNVLLWLHDNGLGGTRTSADWAAMGTLKCCCGCTRKVSHVTRVVQTLDSPASMKESCSSLNPWDANDA
eukprot:gene217-3987_t